MQEATKFDGEKVRMELLPPFAAWSIADVFTFGAKKYDSWNWSKGLAYSRIYGGILRHLFAWYRGEDKDPETGKSHLHHAGCGIMMLIEMEEYRPDLDDRPTHYNKATLQEVIDDFSNDAALGEFVRKNYGKD